MTSQEKDITEDSALYTIEYIKDKNPFHKKGEIYTNCMFLSAGIDKYEKLCSFEYLKDSHLWSANQIENEEFPDDEVIIFELDEVKITKQ